MRLTLVRHAESIWNASHVWQGHADVPLSPRGRLQARALAGRLHGAEFDHRRASDLSRAFETASTLGPLPVPDARFRELDVGEWEGLPHTEIAARFPDDVAALRAGQPVRIGGGESIPELEARADAALDDLRSRHARQRVLLVTHGGVIRAIVMGALGLRGRASPLVGVDNTSLTHLAHDGERWCVEAYNDAHHLDPADVEPTAPLEPALRLVLVAIDPARGSDEGLADRLAAHLGLGRSVAVGAARGHAMSEALLADPVEGAPDEVASALLSEGAVGTYTMVLERSALHRLVVERLGLDARGLAPPPHGSLTELRGGRKRVLLQSYGARLESPPR
jgi:broad specificity phosphatase PhoE